MKTSRDYLIIAILLSVVLAVYGQALRYGFINLDDPSYVTANRVVRAGLTLDGLIWAFTTLYAYNWHPLTWVSHMLDVQLFGLNPLGHHLTSLLFHMANTFLLFLVLRKMTDALWQSVCVAAFFALHPLHVESVAWVAERKDVLSAFFWMLGLWTYVGYAECPNLKRYLIFAMFFVFGLMAKPMVVTFPFVILLLDYWPLRRLSLRNPSPDISKGKYPPRSFTGLVIEKIPLLALTFASSTITYIAQQKSGALVSSDKSSLLFNASHAVVAYASYIKKVFWPTHLAVFYPLNPEALSYTKVLAASLFMLSVSLLILVFARRRPYLVLGWFWYMGTLIPVIGLLRFGAHAMADRYTYIPAIGLFIIISWGAADLMAKWRFKNELLGTSAFIIIAILSCITWLQIRYWQNDITLYEHAINVTKNNWLAHKNIGAALIAQGDLNRALIHVSESLRIKPDPALYTSEAWIYARLGNYEKSIEACRQALAIDPNLAKAHYLLGINYRNLGDQNSAFIEYSVLEGIDAGLAMDLLQYLRKNGD